jgi:FkbM family methyltransferase
MFSRLRILNETPAYPDGVVIFDETDWISRDVLNGLEWEPAICDIMAQHYEPGTDVLDIGANLGLNSISLHKRVPITGTLHLFEPQPDVFSMMKYNTRNIPSRQLYNICLGSHTTVLRFEQHPQNVGRTFMIGPGGMENKTLYDGDVKVPCGNDAVSVVATSLDTIDLCVKNRISLVKIDIEGSEYNVLKGARKTLQFYKPTMIIEIFPENQEAVSGMLKSIGYSRIEQIAKDDFICKF